jgi:EmrB/QacA subfamily drug resistance transporter
MASILNVALPAIQETYGATVAEMQWIASAYTVMLAALTLAGGAMGNRYGRRRMFQVGTVGLALASIAGSLAPNVRGLIVARAAQGLAAALLVPNSLALLSAAFPRSERGRAVGTWSSGTALVGALSPLVGGWFVDVGSWRVAFSIVLPPALIVLALAAWRVPDPPVLRRAPPVDWGGALLATLGLLAIVGGIIVIGSGAPALVALTVGVAALLAFVPHERRSTSPMISPSLFRSRAFRGINLMTILVYTGVSGVFFLVPFDMVQVRGYSTTATGAAFLPFALLVGLLSRRVGGLADTLGIKPLLVAGAMLTAAGLAAFALPDSGGSYWRTFFAPMVVTGLGMALTVAPLTTGVLASVAPADAGVASGVNNTAARVGTLLAVAVIGVVALGLYGRALERRLEAAAVPANVARAIVAERRSLADTTIPSWVSAADQVLLKGAVDAAFLDAFRGSILLCAALVLAGGVVALVSLGATEDSARDLDESASCMHAASIVAVGPSAAVCPECTRLGDRWVHLRVCLTCGHVGCCDSSKNQHATKHFWASQHPIVRSLEPGESWRWCYIDEVAV